jgi:hypothetical protein
MVSAVVIPSLARAEGDDLPRHLLPSAGLTLALSGVSSGGVLLGATDVDVRRTTVFGLPQNVGTVDRILRGVLAATLVGIGSYRLATDQPSPGWSVVFLSTALIPALTAATGYCPLYQALGVDTN